MIKQIVIFDMDGTLADLEHRLHHIQPPKYAHGEGEQEEPKADWPAFFAACDKDAPIHEIIEIMLALDSVGFFIWIVSGRSEAVRGKTLDWLRQHAIHPEKLLMRKADDHRPDEEMKEELITSGVIIPNDVMCVFEDRTRVVGMWRRHGLRVLQVADGNF